MGLWTKRGCALAVVMVAGFGTPGEVVAQHDNLVGIRIMEAVVEDLDADAAKISLSPSDLRTKVELKLRMAGLHVVPASAESLPWLYVQVSVDVRTDSPICIYSVRLQLFESALLLRTRTLAKAELWSAGAYGSGDLRAGIAKQAILESVEKNLDAFLNDWLAANPK